MSALDPEWSAAFLWWTGTVVIGLLGLAVVSVALYVLFLLTLEKVKVFAAFWTWLDAGLPTREEVQRIRRYRLDRMHRGHARTIPPDYCDVVDSAGEFLDAFREGDELGPYVQKLREVTEAYPPEPDDG